jgi:hypothetical protein
MDSYRLPFVAALCLCAGGCFLGTPVAKRGIEIRQDKHIGQSLGPFEVDTSALPAGAVTVQPDRDDRNGDIQRLEISGQIPVKIIIVPATRPAPRTVS